ncbi:uncharacterized protein [Lepeophtheirus salmonis]|uniref:uncharacterized protein n=1 Tax=Lepeophtheirus salmonis TaxID=72036 RepID=UPI001AE3D97F|nr:uncharacterized protein LOC121113800 [Lepeophtheirus salmonis]
MPGGPLAPKKSCVEGKEPEMCDSGADCSMRDVEKTEDRSVFSSQVLDSALCDKDLRTSYVVPQSAAAQCISEKTTGMPLPQDEILPTDVGLNLGLGIKRKMEMSEQHDDLNMPGAKRSKKPKTLSEKRVKLEEDIRKYGHAAVEKMYPRPDRPPTSTVKRKRGPKSGIKMKPKPYGLDFKEIDAQLILRPFSHDKYIQQPEYNSVVYINRRKGMVPLSSLGKDCQSVLSSDAKLLSGRNVSYGKPSLFVKEHGRVIAIGGSRNKENDSLKVIPVPDIKSRLARSQSSLDFIPFYMDEEFTSFAVGAIYSPKKKPKIDIRTWKKMKKNESDKVDLKEVLRKKSIVDHVYDKMLQSVPKKTEEENDPTTTTSEDGSKSQQHNDLDESEDRLFLSDDEEENERENTTTKSANESCKIFNKLLDSTSSFVNPLPDPEGCPVTSAEFRTALKERNSKTLTGYEICDIEDCFCRNAYTLMEVSTPATDGTRTPESNIPTPIENKDQHVVKNLKKVKRALKTLGVNLVEFDVTNGIRKDCDKDFCRLGCICETLSGSPVVPNHCCKIECMFRCHCSEETLKKLSSSRKVAISPSAYTNFQDKSPPNVVTTGGRDLIMIAGRQKRERKMPTRYQDTDALTLESASQDFMSKSEDVFNLDTILVPGKENPNIVKMISNGIRDGVSRKCTVLVPKINLSNLDISVKPWCMYHCRHSCPCFKFENPLDYAPDLSKSRNVARRSSKLVSLICLDDEEKDNDDNVEKETSNKTYKVRKDQCARTEGMCINPSYKLKMPHKFVTVKESAEAEIKGDVISFKLPHDDKKTVIDLTLKPSKAVQYINWYILHYVFTHNIVRIWYFTRNGKFVFFISRFSSPPYMKNSNNVKDLIKHTTDLSNLPIFARELMSTKKCESNSQKFAILTSSGIAWEITGILQKKGDKTTTPLNNKSIKEPSVVNLELSNQRLDPGQNLVTVVQADIAVMQIKLPQTSSNQYWCTLRVPIGEESVPCPETSISLKTIIIKQAADLANSENTTVRIPIEATSVGSSSFGIYAVPCLKKHVFIGPYIVKEVKEFETSSEIDCGLKEEEEDITIIPTIQTPTSNSGCRRKQKLTTKYDEIDRINNEKIITSLVELVADTAVVFGERRKKRRRFSHRPIMGSVPSVVSKEKTIEEISVIEEEKNGSKLQSDILKETSTNNEIPNYRNLPNSDYGIIVTGQIDAKFKCVIDIDIPNQENLKVFKNSIGSDRVQFYHPSFPKHIVMCKDVINARKWMEEYITLAERHSSPLLQPSILKSRLMRCRRKVKKEALTEEQRQEYIQLFYKLRRSMLPEHDASLMYNRVQVIDYATILIQDLKKKVQDQEKVKKELLTLRSGLFDEFTSKLKGLPIDLKKKFVYDLKTGLKKGKPSPESQQPASLKPPPVAIIQRSFTNKKVSNAMPDLIPIHGDIEGPSKSAATTKTLPPPEEKKNRKPLNAFMLWAKKQRPKFVSSGLSTGELSRMLVDKWHQLSQKERQQYQIEAARLKKLNSNMESSDTTDKELLCSEKKKVVEEQDDNSIIVLDEKPSKKISPPIIEISLD